MDKSPEAAPPTPPIRALARAAVEAHLAKERSCRLYAQAHTQVLSNNFVVGPRRLQEMKSESSASIKAACDADKALADAINRAIVAALGRVDIVAAVEEYEFRPDEGSHSPTEFEKALLIDFASGLIGEFQQELRPLIYDTAVEP